MKIGTLLLEANLINHAQLEEALQAQIMFGGRLGTNLVELGHISEDQLAQTLGKQMGIPFCQPENLQNIPPEVLGTLPKEMVEKYKAIPIKRQKKELWVAMVDPNQNAFIEEMAFATNYKIRPMIAPEIRLAEAMEHYYEIQHAKRTTLPETDKTAGYETESKRPNQTGSTRPAHFRELGITTADQVTPIDPHVPDQLFPLEDIAEVLTESRSKEDIFQALSSPFMEFFKRYIIFVNQNDTMMGLESSGNGFQRDQIQKIGIPLKVPSIFRDVIQAKSTYFGTFPNDHNHKKIRKILDHPMEEEPFLLCPVPLVEKVGIVIYADGPSDIMAIANRIKKFNLLGMKAGLALQVLVLKQKILHL